MITEGTQRVLCEEDQYVLNQHKSGILLFKVIAQTTTVDNRSTVAHLDGQLLELDQYMMKCGQDVELFNKHVKTTITALKARGHKPDNLVIKLFKGYKVVTDRHFNEWYQRKNDAYDEGTNFTPESLMSLAVNKFSSLKKKGEWTVNTAVEDNVVALQTTIKELKDSSLVLKKAMKERFSKLQRDRTRPKDRDHSPWKLVEPKEGEPKTKSNRGKTYHWCQFHQLWTIHKPTDCRLDPNHETNGDANGGDDQGKGRAKSYAAVTEVAGDRKACSAIFEDFGVTWKDEEVEPE